MFTELVEAIFSTFITVMSGMAGGLKTAFNELIYVDPLVENPAFSPLILFLFTFAGVAIGMGLLYKVFDMIRAHRG